MGSFLEACGAAGPVVVDVEGPGLDGVARRTFHQPSVLIGAHAAADLVLDRRQGVHRRHALLQVLGGRIACLDLGSRDGEPRGDAPPLPLWVVPGQPFGIGPYRLTVRAGTGGDSAPPPDLPGPLSAAYARLHPLPAVALEIDGAREAGPVTYPISRVLTLIGRAPSCKLKIGGPGASRYCAALVRTPNGMWLVDLLPSRGITVDGRAVRHAWLAEGAELQAGPCTMRVRYEVLAGLAAPPAPRPDPAGAIASRPPLGPAPEPTARALAAGQIEPPELALQPLLVQVAQMQQQMCDQFQQAMMMMSQLFGSMHRDQMQVIREELEQIRELTAAMRTMQREAAAAGAAPQPARTGTAPSAGAASAAANLPPPAPPGPATTPHPRHDPQTIHSLVGERLAHFEAERQRRWNRILKVLAGD